MSSQSHASFESGASFTTMGISIVEYQVPSHTHSLYDVSFFGDQIHTLLTRSPAMVDSWISETHRLNPSRPLLVGLDVEWRPNNRHFDNPIATLQLCVARRCLIFQILHAPFIPNSLLDFLSCPSNSFLGVGIDTDAQKLLGDYSLRVANAVDLRPLAAEGLGDPRLRTAGLKTLAKAVMGKQVEKPKRVTRSRWDSLWLSPSQVQYACVDAFLSSEIGYTLNVQSSQPATEASVLVPLL